MYKALSILLLSLFSCSAFAETSSPHGSPFPPFYPGPSFGHTVAEIHTQFIARMEYNFENNPNINNSIAALSPVEIENLARYVTIESGGDTSSFLSIASVTLNAANWNALSLAFAVENTPNTAMHIMDALPTPTLDMSLYEIYLDYATASDLSAMASLAYTAQYAGTWLGGAFTVGYSVGTAIYWIDDQIDPNENNTLGYWEYSMVSWMFDDESNEDW